MPASIAEHVPTVVPHAGVSTYRMKSAGTQAYVCATGIVACILCLHSTDPDIILEITRCKEFVSVSCINSNITWTNTVMEYNVSDAGAAYDYVR